MPPAERSSEAAPPRRLLPTLFAGVFMAALDTAVIAPALPALRAAFAIGHREAGLLMVVFILCSLGSTALLAHLGDRHGRRAVFLGSVACFAAGSLLIALSGSFAMLLAGRAVQGLGGGGILPTAMALIGDAVAPRERGRALGLIGALYGMAFVLGPPLATLLMLAAGWPWIFLLNLPIAALVLGLGVRSLPHHTPRAAQPPLDLAAAVVGATADFGGGGIRVHAVAYLGVAPLMLLMLPAALALRHSPNTTLAAETAA